MTWNFVVNNMITYRDQRLRGAAFFGGLAVVLCHRRGRRGGQCRHRAELFYERGGAGGFAGSPARSSASCGTSRCPASSPGAGRRLAVMLAAFRWRMRPAPLRPNAPGSADMSSLSAGCAHPVGGASPRLGLVDHRCRRTASASPSPPRSAMAIGESYYVATARHLALSYFDQPPLSLWMAWAMIKLFGAQATCSSCACRSWPMFAGRRGQCTGSARGSSASAPGRGRRFCSTCRSSLRSASHAGSSRMGRYAVHAAGERRRWSSCAFGDPSRPLPWWADGRRRLRPGAAVEISRRTHPGGLVDLRRHDAEVPRVVLPSRPGSVAAVIAAVDLRAGHRLERRERLGVVRVSGRRGWTGAAFISTGCCASILGQGGADQRAHLAADDLASSCAVSPPDRATPKAWFLCCLAIIPMVLFTAAAIWAPSRLSPPLAVAAAIVFLFPLLGKAVADRMAAAIGRPASGSAPRAVLVVAAVAFLGSEARFGWVERVLPRRHEGVGIGR